MSGPDDFNDEQKRYLEGFVSGQAAARAAKGLGPLFPTEGGGEAARSGPEAIHFRAQSRFIVEGKKLVAEEEAKRKKNPLDMWDELAANAREARFPKGTDVFLYKFHGLFYVAPAQDSFMCRLRSERHPRRAPAARGGRPRGALRRGLRARHHPRQPSDP